MNRIIKSMENKYLESSLNMIRRTFTQSEDAESVGLPAPRCLMVQELEPDACKRINGVLDYSFYEALR